MEEHVHLKINMRSMYIFGLLPCKFERKLLNFLHELYGKFVLTYLTIFVLSEYIQVCRIIDRDLFDIVSILAVSLLYSATILKILVCNGSTIKGLVNQILTTERKLFNYGNSTLAGIYYKHVRWNYFADRLLIYVGILTVLPYYFNPVLEQIQNEEILVSVVDNVTVEKKIKPLPFNTWFPFDEQEYYYQCYTYHVVAAFFGGGSTVATDIFFVGLMTFAIGQIKILQFCFENSGKIATTVSESLEIPKEQSIRIVIGYCIKMHKVVIK